MSYIAWSVIAGETPTATKWNELGGNDADFETRLGYLEAVPVTSVTSDTTPNPDASHVRNLYEITALAGDAAFAAPSGSPNDGDGLIIRIKDDGGTRALTFDTIYRAGTDVPLPTTTVSNKTMYLLFIYNATDTKWDLVDYTDNI